MVTGSDEVEIYAFGDVIEALDVASLVYEVGGELKKDFGSALAEDKHLFAEVYHQRLSFAG